MQRRYQVAMPQKDPTGAAIGSAGITALGTIFGGPAGGAAGSVVGGKMMQDQMQGPQTVQAPEPSAAMAENETAVQRRMMELRNQSLLKDGLAAIDANPRLKQQYGPVLQSALNRSMNGGTV